MDFLPISMCYAAMLVKVIQCWSDNKDMPKNQILMNHQVAGNFGRMWRSNHGTVVNISLNQSTNKPKKLDASTNATLDMVHINITEPTTTEKTIHTSNYSNLDLLVTERSSPKITGALFHRLNATLTRSKDAVWATISLTFICIVLLLAVAHSRMWKDYHGSETQYGIPRPDFNERVPLKEVLEHKMAMLKEFIKRKENRKRSPLVELESLLHSNDENET